MYSLCVLFLVYNYICIISGIHYVTYIKGTSMNEPLVEFVRQNLRRNNDDYADINIDLKNFVSNNEIKADKGTNKKAKVIYSNHIKNKERITTKTELSQEYQYLKNSDELIVHDTSYIPKQKELTTNKNSVNDLVTTKIMTITKSLYKARPSYNSRKEMEMSSSKSTIIRLSQENFKNQNTTSIKNILNPFKKFLLKKKESILNSVIKKIQIPLLSKNLMQSTKETESIMNASKKNVLNTRKIITTPIIDYTKNKINKMNLRTPKKFNNIEEDGENTDNGLPNPNSLDMAPAKGAQINIKRIKGRLCDRHVLFPEGPKYDSKGRWYLPEHAKVISQPYANTRAPALILPRCCNCCKKSVLGCE